MNSNVVGFKTTSAISAYHHWCCEFKSQSGCTTLCDKFCQWLATGRWFSQGPPVSSKYLSFPYIQTILNPVHCLQFTSYMSSENHIDVV
jgi:hypothetical protein